MWQETGQDKCIYVANIKSLKLNSIGLVIHMKLETSSSQNKSNRSHQRWEWLPLAHRASGKDASSTYSPSSLLLSNQR